VPSYGVGSIYQDQETGDFPWWVCEVDPISGHAIKNAVHGFGDSLQDAEQSQARALQRLLGQALASLDAGRKNGPEHVHQRQTIREALNRLRGALGQLEVLCASPVSGLPRSSSAASAALRKAISAMVNEAYRRTDERFNADLGSDGVE